MRGKINFSVIMIVFMSLLLSGFKYETREGLDLIGKAAPEFRELTWLNTEPLSIKGLRGKVVLIRFWLVGCPYCTKSAPSLVDFYQKYKDKGLVIIGIHHPKSKITTNNYIVKQAADALGFNFPIAQDLNWSTINSYWLVNKKRTFTSSSILIDKKGITRFVHDGGNYFSSDSDIEANAAFEAMEFNIIKLLNE